MALDLVSGYSSIWFSVLVVFHFLICRVQMEPTKMSIQLVSGLSRHRYSLFERLTIDLSFDLMNSFHRH